MRNRWPFLRVVLAILAMFYLTPGAFIAYWQFADSEVPIRDLEQRILSVTPRAIIVRQEWTADRQCEALAERWLVDGTVETLSSEALFIRPGRDGRQPYSRRVELPPMSPGQVNYVVRMKFVCNPWHRVWPIIYDLPPLPFDLVESYTPSAVPDAGSGSPEPPWTDVDF